MKVSLRWIFDHIDHNWKTVSLDLLTTKFNSVTAEIDRVSPTYFSPDTYALGTITARVPHAITLFVPELQTSFTLPVRHDLPAGDITGLNTTYLIALNPEPRWASVRDFGLEKESLLPAFHTSPERIAGDWKKDLECDDVILEVDNKSITHRPDMWGHRGFAREIAAFLNLSLIKQEEFLQEPITQTHTQETSITIRNEAPMMCMAFSALECTTEKTVASNLSMALRLCRVGTRPMSGIVDLTNYVMLDWGQPMHAYDANRLTSKTFVIRMAQDKEKLTLLDKTTIEMTPHDLVIADPQQALGLAGVMGGNTSGIRPSTRSIILESAQFNPGCIRKTAARYKMRSEASARFEKTLDPFLARQGILRFIKLIYQYNVDIIPQGPIFTGNSPEMPTQEYRTITVSHDFLVKRSGMSLTDKDIVRTCTALGFEVGVQHYAEGDANPSSHLRQGYGAHVPQGERLHAAHADASMPQHVAQPARRSLGEGWVEASSGHKATYQDKRLSYTINVPSFRSTKDVTTQEDILEEIVRSIGFENIPHTLPALSKRATDLTALSRKRSIKTYLMSAARMTEQKNYAFYDEPHIAKLGWPVPAHHPELLNPVAQTQRRLVQSLIPGLLKNIEENIHDEEHLRFFEWGRVWSFDVAHNPSTLRRAQGERAEGLHAEGSKHQDERHLILRQAQDERFTADAHAEVSKHEAPLHESQSLAGIFFHKRQQFNFYEAKELVTGIFSLLHTTARWQKATHPISWLQANQAAILEINGIPCGYGGIIDQGLVQAIGGMQESSAFGFEINATTLLNLYQTVPAYTPSSKFQGTTFDLSFFIPLALTTEELENSLATSHACIDRVHLIDFFEKEEWLDKRSLAFRIWISDPSKTLTKEEIETIRLAAIASVTNLGGILRVQ